MFYAIDYFIVDVVSSRTESFWLYFIWRLAETRQIEIKMDAVYSAFNSQLVNENKQFEREMKSWAELLALAYNDTQAGTSTPQYSIGISSSSSSSTSNNTYNSMTIVALLPPPPREWVRDRALSTFLRTGAESYKITVVVVFSNKCQRKSHFMCARYTLFKLVSGYVVVLFLYFILFLLLFSRFYFQYIDMLFLLFHYLLRRFVFWRACYKL